MITDDTEFFDAVQLAELPTSAPTEHQRNNDILLRQQAVQDELEEELCCAVCLRLAFQPTTLVCGHTSCRVCLARWYFSSNRKECPLCRDAYHGHPKINTQLRSMMQKLYPVKFEEREKELLENADDLEVVKKYDDALSKEKAKSDSKDTDMASFCSGIFLALCGSLVAYLVWHFWQSPESNLLVLKPAQTWKPRHVASWLREMSWAKDYADLAETNNIDGKLLLSLDEQGVETFLNVTDSQHRKGLLLAISMLENEGMKMPSSLWEYKTLFPGRCLFLVFGLKDFPRTSLLYMWLYFYEDMFVPFVHSTSQSNDDPLVQMDLPADDGPSTSQWVTFLVFAVLMPNKLFIAFTLQFFDKHRFTSAFVFVTAATCQCLEYLSWYSFLKKPRISILWAALKRYYKHITSAFMFTLVWPIIPSIICDVFFYCALYFSPFQVSKSLYDFWRGMNQDLGRNF